MRKNGKGFYREKEGLVNSQDARGKCDKNPMVYILKQVT
jgi:hypothetical protein